MGDATRDLVPTLRRAGLRVASGTEKDLVLSLPGHARRHVELKFSSGRLGSATTSHRTRGGRPVLYAAETATAAVVAAAESGEFDLVTFDPVRVIVAGHTFLQPDQRPRSIRTPGKPAWGAQAVLRILATANRPIRQAELSTIVGITRQAVSLALKQAGDHVTRVEQGWIARGEALSAWLDSYPGPGGLATHWYGLDLPAEQATAALSLLDELALTGVVSGDLAADRYAPWQLPTTVRLYIPEVVDFTPVGFSPATPAEATLTAVVPLDPTINHTAAALARTYVDRHLLADPAITMWDLLNTTSATTAREAADRLDAAIASGTLNA